MESVHGGPPWLRVEALVSHSYPSGPKFGLPLVGRQADIWNGRHHGDDDQWREMRDPEKIELSVTPAGEPPADAAAAEQWLERLAHDHELGITHDIMDLGHPPDAEPILRFVEQVFEPMRRS